MVLMTLLMLFNMYLYGQKDNTYLLDSVVISAERIPVESVRSVRSVSLVQVESLPPKPYVSLNDFLSVVPGLFANNATNYAQDLRISLRGFGARASFGIRGVKLIVDGFEETTPDGQGQVDNLDLLNLHSIEVLRGPSSVLHGNASGGVIRITTVKDFDQNYLNGYASGASFASRQLSLGGGFISGSARHQIRLSHMTSEGHRTHSSFQSTIIGYNGVLDAKGNEQWMWNLSYMDSPEALDPGGIDLAASATTPYNARDRNVHFNAGETVRQMKGSAQYDGENFRGGIYLSSRSFAGRLPFANGGWIELDRLYGGLNADYSIDKVLRQGVNKLLIGLEWGFQRDDRKRYINEMGIKRELNFDQLESFHQQSLYVLDRYIIDRWEWSGGLRLDLNQLKAGDHFLTDGDDSGKQSYHSLNPSLGVNFRINAGHFLFANTSTSFETPALSELSSNPSGAGGFNMELLPQKAVNFELGYRLSHSRISMSAALFHIETRDDIISFELDEFPGRDFYKNSARSTRKGIELEVSMNPLKYWYIDGALTIADYSFDDFVESGQDFSGNDIPGVPQRHGSISLSYRQDNGLRAGLLLRSTGSIALNNKNDVYDRAYSLLSFSAGHSWKMKGFMISPFFGIENLLDTFYHDNIRINAFGGRYYEPGPGVYFYGGVRMGI